MSHSGVSRSLKPSVAGLERAHNAAASDTRGVFPDGGQTWGVRMQHVYSVSVLRTTQTLKERGDEHRLYGTETSPWRAGGVSRLSAGTEQICQHSVRGSHPDSSSILPGVTLWGHRQQKRPIFHL